MTLGELKQILARIDDDNLEVVFHGLDHSFDPIHTAYNTTALKDGSYYHEDYGEDITPEKEYGRRVNVFVFE